MQDLVGWFNYGHPRNRFWPVMAAVFHDDSCLCENTDPIQTVRTRKGFALRHHMALWDVIASCDIEGASDASIRNVVPNDFSDMLRQFYHCREGCAAVPATLHSAITDAWVGQCADDSTAVHQSDERRRQAARACRGVQLRRPSGFRQSRNAARIIWSKRCRYCPNPIYTIACALKALLLKGFQGICPIHGETDVFEDMNETEGER